MPTFIKLAGAALALMGLILKWNALHTQPGTVFLSGLGYVTLVVGLALIVLGFTFRFFLFKDDQENSSNPRPLAKGS
ncbi:MAG: hypothetical protein A2V67_18940 [Deltaproteobacteria bacterium RBG_13_61_14]|nr:MAG: hypothetical protein A2V67_18940 [Deltaproteobacteria bacterium RBG_13_61_14]